MQSRAIVVEGYTDVIALHQPGIDRAVASMGTALTEDQVRELRRLCGTARSTWPSTPTPRARRHRCGAWSWPQSTGLDVRVVQLPDGRDPADVAVPIRTPSRRRSTPSGVLCFRIGRVLAAGGSRDQRLPGAGAVLAAAPPSVERDELVRLVADRLELTDDLEAGADSPPGGAQRRPATPRDGCGCRPGSETSACSWPCAWPCPSAVGFDSVILNVAHFADASHWEAATHIRRHAGG